MSIRRQFPDEESLRDYYRRNVVDLVASVKAVVGQLENEYIAKLEQRKRGTIAIAAGVAGLFFWQFLVDINIYSFSVILAVVWSGLFVLCFMLIVWGSRQVYGTTKVIQAFNQKLNQAIFPSVFQVFGLEADHLKETKETMSGSAKSEHNSPWQKVVHFSRGLVHQHDSPEKSQFKELLEQSELITEPKNRINIDDLVHASLYNRTLLLSELDVKHETGSGKNRRVKNIFKGYFVAYDLEQVLDGKTFVSTEGDQSGFGHQSFMSSLRGTGVEKTELEWNDFESLLHVVSDNPIEARYILTPDFMQDLHDWWLGRKQNIRLSFIGQKMYILFPDTGIRLGKTINKIEEEEIVSYLESIGLPLLHILHLIEDLET